MYLDIAKKIIHEQEVIIGPIAWDEADRVSELDVDRKKKTIVFADAVDESKAIDALVRQYEKLFGQASVEVCRDAVQALLAKMDKKEIPLTLR